MKKILLIGAIFLFVFSIPLCVKGVSITEICPSGCASSGSQWIELINNSDQTINGNDLIFWENETNHKVKMACKGTTAIKPNDIFIIAQDADNFCKEHQVTDMVVFDSSWGSLKKSGETIGLKLKSNTDTYLDLVTYPASTGGSVEKNSTGAWITNNEGHTAGNILNPSHETGIYISEDIYTGQNIVIKAEHDCSAGCQWSIDNLNIGYGHELEHTFNTPGTYTLTLKINNDQAEHSTNIYVLDPPTQNYPKEPVDYHKITESILITEIFPNPKGSDSDNEFIEIFNNSDKTINLSGWQIDDSEGGSKPYTLPKNTRILPEEYLVLYRDETGLALNNTQDEVRILSPDSDELKKINYTKCEENLSIIRTSAGAYLTHGTPTPGNENVISQKNDKQDNLCLKIDLKDLNNLANQKCITTKGVVFALPGQLASQYMYIGDELTSLQVYSYHQDFPNLNLGDEIEVTGELSDLNQEKRLKTNASESIEKLASNKHLTPISNTIENINKINLTTLVRACGEVTESKSTSLYLDDGTDEIKVSIKKDLEIEKFWELGSLICITGIFIPDKKPKIVLRSPEDIYMDKQFSDAALILNKNILKPPTNSELKYKITTLVFFLICCLVVVYRKYKKN